MFTRLFELFDRLLSKESQGAPGPVRRSSGNVGAAANGARPASVKPASNAIEVPLVCADPGRYARVPGAAVWQFNVPDAEQACKAALALAGQHVGAISAAATPLPGCDRRSCTCNYRRLPERRKIPRRSGEERRELVRFEVKKIDRRKNDGRRKEDGWSGAKP